MLSEAAQFLIAALGPLHQGICVDCAARALECSPEESLKVTKELISSGEALARFEACALCNELRPATRLRLPSSYWRPDHTDDGEFQDVAASRRRERQREFRRLLHREVGGPAPPRILST